MVRLTAELVAGFGGLLGGEITLLLFGDFKQSIGCGLGTVTHCANIQGSCISVQCTFFGQTKWKPLIMSFARFYGLAVGQILPSRLA